MYSEIVVTPHADGFHQLTSAAHHGVDRMESAI